MVYRWKYEGVVSESPLNLQPTLTPNVLFDRPCPWTGAGRRKMRASVAYHCVLCNVGGTVCIHYANPHAV